MSQTLCSRKNQNILISLLDPFGPASFVILDTDYDNYALVCTCQSKKFLFEVLTFHRRSCTILQRSSEKDASISRKVIFAQLILMLKISFSWLK